jgi:hypothetical protein
MDPVTAAAVASSTATAGEASAVAASTMEATATSTAFLEGTEAAEASEAIVGEKGLLEQMSTIHHSSMEAVAARNEAAIKDIPQIEINRIDGAAREEAVGNELMMTYPSEEGYNIESETYLRNHDGSVARDPGIQEAGGLEGTRRLDFVVIKDGKVIKSVEVTSESAPKTLQSAKEDRIRAEGGNYILDRTTGELVPFAPGVQTEIVRRA